MNRTLLRARTSWVESARSPTTDFPIQNLPLGVFRRAGASGPGTIGVAIGDEILDLAGCRREALLDGLSEAVLRASLEPALNALMALPRAEVTSLRERLSDLLAEGPVQPRRREQVSRLLTGRREAEMLLPCAIGGYTDFYASIDHARNVGRLFRPDNPLLPNYKFVPIGYHGRASSIVTSGTPVRRPVGQTRPRGAEAPRVGPTERLDYELEVGCFIGRGSDLGRPIPIEDAADHLFGLCLLNDWSARDVQQWEAQPLGPFLAKNFATTISPWVVTWDALEPFRVPAAPRPEGDPQPLPYLDSAGHRRSGGLALTLSVGLRTGRMRGAGRPVSWLTESAFARMYWTFDQMVAHHTSGGCNLRPGDLIASGTVSGPSPRERGCLLELTSGGASPFDVDGEPRTFLEDGDEVVIRGRCEREGFVGIGFGECSGIILPAAPISSP
jgi:fumarylacetoacetase